MTSRYLVYPLVVLAAGQLVSLWRSDRRWHGPAIAQRGVILGMAGLALFLPVWRALWIILGWLLFIGCSGLPRWFVALANRHRRAGDWLAAAHWEDRLGRFLMGPHGQLHRQHAQALRHLAWDEADRADELLVQLAHRPLPAAARGMVTLWRLQLLAEQRAWDRVVAVFESTADWGTLWFTTRARLLAARAYGETDDMSRALRSAQLVVLSPVIARLGSVYWQTRVRLAALAGDTAEVESLLGQRPFWRMGFQRYATYWRGRAALARGDQATAIKLLSRAHALTHPRDRGWHDAIRHHLQRAEAGIVPFPPPVDVADYAPALAAVRLAEDQAAPWRALMQLGQPAPATLILIGELLLIFAGWTVLPADWATDLLVAASNGSLTIRSQEWWRLVTALMLHANWLHIAMNSLALWSFGSAIERACGWGRMLVVFVVGGALGNLLSAATARDDLAIGASAGVFALLGAFTVAVGRLRAAPYAGLRRRLLTALAVLVAADFLIGALEPQIDNLAHIGGYGAGLLLGLWAVRRRDYTVSVGSR